MQIAIVLYPGLTALDALGPYEVLRFIPGCDLRFVSHRPGPVVADSGVLVTGATHSFEETPSPDIVLVPGSQANTPSAMADGKLLKWLQNAHKTSQYTTSVCSGALILGAAEILRGHPATTHWFAQKHLTSFGAQPRPHDRVVTSGKIMTAAGVSAGIDLALALVDKHCGRQWAETVQLIIEYDPQPPFDSGHMSKATEEVRKLAQREMAKRSGNIRNLAAVPKILWQRTLNKTRSKK